VGSDDHVLNLAPSRTSRTGIKHGDLDTSGRNREILDHALMASPTFHNAGIDAGKIHLAERDKMRIIRPQHAHDRTSRVRHDLQGDNLDAVDQCALATKSAI